MVAEQNILYGLQKVGTNIANVPEEQTVRSITFTRNSDGWITSSASSDTAAWTMSNANIPIQLEAKNYTIVWELSSDSNDTVEMGLFMSSGTLLFNMSATTSNRKVTRAFTISSGDVGTYHIMYKTRTQKARLLVVETSVYNAYSEYQSYSASNSELTVLEAEDRAALAEEIDAGAKNKWDFANCGNGNWHATTSKTDTSFTITSTDTRAYFSMWQSLPAGDYVFSAKISNRSGPDYTGIVIRANGTSGTDLGPVINFSANGTISGKFTCTATTTVYFVCYASMDSFTGATSYTASDIMVCTKAAFGVSPKYVPYAKSNYSLTQYTDGCTLDTSGAKTNTALNTVNQNTFAKYGANVDQKPTGHYYYCKTDKFSNDAEIQTAVNCSDGRSYSRVKDNGNWGAWNPLGIGHRVYCKNKSASFTHTYSMSFDDINNNESDGDWGAKTCGLYMVYIITWSTTPAISVYSVAYSGGQLSQASVVKIGGADAAVSVDNGTISITSSGKVEIYAMG